MRQLRTSTPGMAMYKYPARSGPELGLRRALLLHGGPDNRTLTRRSARPVALGWLSVDARRSGLSEHATVTRGCTTCVAVKDGNAFHSGWAAGSRRGSPLVSWVAGRSVTRRSAAG